MSLILNENSVAPILRLPLELIAEIAVAGRNNSQPGEKYRWEMTMSQVCRRIRHAVVTAPALWTWVTIKFSNFGGSMKLSQLYFERSAACRLQVTLHAGITLTIHPSRLAHLVPHLNRVSRLIVIGTNASLLHLFREAPWLEHLEVEDVGPIDLSPLGSSKITSFKLTYGSLCSPLPQWMGALTQLELRKSRSLVRSDATLLGTIESRLPSLTHLHYETSAIPDSVLYRGFASRSLTHLCLEIASNLNSRSHIDKLLQHALPRFDTPGLAHLDIRCASARPVSNLFNTTYHVDTARPSFPALTSLAFTNDAENCECDGEFQNWNRSWISRNLNGGRYHSLASPPFHLFPALSSLGVVNQCYTAGFLVELLCSNSSPSPVLETITLCPPQKHVAEVWAVLRVVVGLKRNRQQALPIFRLSPDLFNRTFWAENGVHVELIGEGDTFGSVF